MNRHRRLSSRNSDPAGVAQEKPGKGTIVEGTCMAQEVDTRMRVLVRRRIRGEHTYTLPASSSAVEGILAASTQHGHQCCRLASSALGLGRTSTDDCLHPLPLGLQGRENKTLISFCPSIYYTCTQQQQHTLIRSNKSCILE
jgi:hypothetical protein